VGVEQGGEGAEDAGLGLAAEAEEDEVVAREDGVDDLGDDGIVIADDAGEEGLSVALAAGGDLAEACDEVVAELVLDAASYERWGELAGAELA
jgi:hypothetical protein